MPKVTYTAAKGLIQEAGSGIAFSGNQLVGNKKKTISSSTTLTLADSGCVIAALGTAQTFTLPAVATAAGFYVTFHNGSVANHIINGGGAKIQGAIYHNTAGTTLARQAVTDRSQITLAGAVGDYLTIVGDGTNYYVFGWCNAAVTLA